ncbi:hypothetical protein GAYE_SCF02G2100 [Galdieria yellowstonensis]|uniref:E2F/DP family winged-helix DNA-binding domain-containing protein n=1 Tax=Galdieria yellowstonensis TaxID=3028027 RepID=A0AAV9IAE5_9RHOD|nr:hypothetical protein GAYE_SCF02G2100 [Galdieria yellowstonensis]
MDLFQSQSRVSVDSFVNPVEARSNYAKRVSSTPTVDTAARQTSETSESVSADLQRNINQQGALWSCDWGSNRAESQTVRVQVNEASIDAENIKLKDPALQIVPSKEACYPQRYKEREKNTSSFRFQATDAVRYEERSLGTGCPGKTIKNELNRFSWKEEASRGTKRYSLVSNKRGYKSLSLLCENFIKLYGNHSNEEFFVDQVARLLNVGRRRIYDIVNVLESIGIVVKKKRNHYTWQGVDRIPFTLIALKVSNEVGNVLKQPSSYTVNTVESPSSSSDECSMSSQKDEDSEGETQLSPHQNDQNDKVLGVLTQRFIKLFLESNESVISFQEIIRLLLGEQDKDVKSKTGIRRLYDIANILSALQLIQKTQNWNGEMAYQWLLSEVTYLHMFKSNKPSEEKNALSRKRDISSCTEYQGVEHLKPKLLRPNEANEFCHSTDSNPSVSKDLEVSVAQSFQNQVASTANQEETHEASMDCCINANQVQGVVPSAYTYLPNWFTASNLLFMNNYSSYELRSSLAEFQRNIIQLWSRWFEHLPATFKLERSESSVSVSTSLPNMNFIPVPPCWSIWPFPQSSVDVSSSYGNNDVVDEDDKNSEGKLRN